MEKTFGPEIKRGLLSGKTFAVLVADGYDEHEINELLVLSSTHNAIVEIVAEQSHAVRAWSDGWSGPELRVDLSPYQLKVSGLEGVIIPGGVLCVDSLRRSPQMVKLVTQAISLEKVVMTIGRGASMLINLQRGLHVSSDLACEVDLINAGLVVTNDPVSVSGHVLSARSAWDVAAMIARLVQLYEVNG
jgi:protease I